MNHHPANHQNAGERSGNRSTRQTSEIRTRQNRSQAVLRPHVRPAGGSIGIADHLRAQISLERAKLAQLEDWTGPGAWPVLQRVWNRLEMLRALNKEGNHE